MSEYIITLSDEYEGEAKLLNVDTEKEYTIKLEYGTQKGNMGDTYIRFNTKDFEGDKEIKPVELFEQELSLNNEQRQKLFESWGHTRAIMIKDVIEKLSVSRDTAIGIIALANKYNLITRGHNNTWRVIEDTVQDRWKSMAIELKTMQKRKPEAITVQESLDKLAKMSTPEQKAKARGEAYVVEENRIVKEKEESPVEVIDENKIYSGAAQAKAEERKRWDREVKEGGEKAKAEMNKQSTSLPTCVTDLTEQYEQNRPTPVTKGQNLPKKKPLIHKPVRRK